MVGQIARADRATQNGHWEKGGLNILTAIFVNLFWSNKQAGIGFEVEPGREFKKSDAIAVNWLALGTEAPRGWSRTEAHSQFTMFLQL